MGWSSIVSMRQRCIRPMTSSRLDCPKAFPSLIVKRFEAFSVERRTGLSGFGRKIFSICCKVGGGIGFEKTPRGGLNRLSNSLVVHSKMSPADVILGEMCFFTCSFHRKNCKASSRSSNNLKILKSEFRCFVSNTSLSVSGLSS